MVGKEIEEDAGYFCARAASFPHIHKGAQAMVCHAYDSKEPCVNAPSPIEAQTEVYFNSQCFIVSPGHVRTLGLRGLVARGLRFLHANAFI